MHSIIIFILGILTIQIVNAQDTLNSRDGEKNNIILFGNLSFTPEKEIYNYDFNLNKCFNIDSQQIYLDSLEISRDIFLNINLIDKDINEYETHYRYNYKNQDSNQCIEKICYLIKIKIPIKINKKLIDTTILSSSLFKSNEIISIKRKKLIFRKPFVEIITRQ